MKQIFNKTRALMLLAIMSLSAVLCQAQTSFKVTGHVTDEEGEPLAAVGIKAGKSDKNIALTDIDGSYTVSVNGPTTLTFDFIGMQAQKVKVDHAGTYDVVMKSSNEALDDVVVVGYGVQKKINLTGAVQSVSNDEILKRSVSNGSSVLQGIVPGLQAIQSSGQPGNDGTSIRIRGIGSMNSTQSPLVLVDGIESDLNRIDLNQIESMSVLKDGASASIYGSRASNGVILITTKRGKEGKPKVSFNGYVGWNKPTEMPKSVNAVEYLRAMDQANLNDNGETKYDDLIAKYETEGADNISLFDTDWRSLILKKQAFTQNYSVNVSGGGDFAKVFASAGYFQQDGMVPNNSFERTSLRLNSDLKINKWISFGADMSVRQSVVNNPIGSATELIGYAMTFLPTLSAVNNDGTWGYGLQGNNPIAAINDGGYSKSVAPEYVAKLSLNITPFKGMTITGNYTWKRNEGRTKAFANTYEEFEGGTSKGTFPTKNKAASEERTTSVHKQYNLMGTYENTFAEKHYLKAMFGFQSEEFNYNSLGAKRQNYYYDGYEDITHGDVTTASNSSYRYDWTMMAYVFRLNYIFNNRYLFEVNGRYDGTSRFLADRRWGLFPSVSAGWRISEENFWESIRPVVDNLKVRGSFGRLGNQNIGSYFPYLAAISAKDDYGYWFDKTFTGGAAQVQLANTIIGWEKSKQWDLGLDFSMFNGRLNGTFDYYVRTIEDMLQQFQLPEFVAMDAPWENAGTMRNRGWEISLSWNDRIGDWSYFVKANLSDVRNKVLDLFGNYYLSGGSITTEGLPISSYYGYVADGFFQSYDQINKTDDEGNYVYPVYGDRANVKPGDIMYRDLTGDGKITDADRQYLGDKRPHYDFGFSFGFDWKGIDFSAQFQGVGQRNVYYSGGGAKALVGNATLYEHQLDAWSEDNPNATFPRLHNDPNGSHYNNIFSTFWIQSGAYCRLKNLVVGYTLPRKWTRKATIERVRFYATAQNLFTIRGDNFYKGFDPETSAGSSCYPINKTFLFGVNLEF